MVRKFLVSALMLLGASSAFADKVSSPAHHFSADFPGQATQAADEDNATDASGNVISKISTFQDVGPGRYMAIIMVDTYLSPYSVTPSVYMKKHVAEFADGIKGTATSQDTTFEGNPAIQFTFASPSLTLSGEGRIVYVGTEKPVGYMMIAGRMANATADDTAKLDAFMKSFDIN
ncbi:MAG TPA: hypothetical protein VGO52_05815 [Hyphomonadaceae bacterium]|jgi:hypothetical protein|nr:hypothetical protein [Hyphomonadaceae bacterium]